MFIWITEQTCNLSTVMPQVTFILTKLVFGIVVVFVATKLISTHTHVPDKYTYTAISL